MRALAIVTLIILVLAVLVLSRAVVRLENYRYGNFVGLREKFDLADPAQRIKREDCLNNTETRTHWFWHLLYGTRVL